MFSLLTVILFLSTISFNNYFFEKSVTRNKIIGIGNMFLQNSYAIEEDNDKDNNDKEDEDASNNNKKDKSIFNIVAVGDWDCTGEAEDTVDNVVNQDPELVLALGDFSYSGDAADCWLELIEPIADKTKIVLGNHEDEDDYMDFSV